MGYLRLARCRCDPEEEEPPEEFGARAGFGRRRLESLLALRRRLRRFSRVDPREPGEGTWRRRPPVADPARRLRLLRLRACAVARSETSSPPSPAPSPAPPRRPPVRRASRWGVGKVNEHSAWGGSAYNSGFGVARSSPEHGGVLGAVDCTAFYFKYHLHLHAVPVEGRGADSLSNQLEHGSQLSVRSACSPPPIYILRALVFSRKVKTP